MPMTLPSESYSGPPESPEMTAALISIMSVSVSAFVPFSSLAVSDWPVATTVPVAALGVPPTPPALPTTVIWSAAATVEESPIRTVCSPDAFCSCSTATSSVGSVPTTVAVYVAPVLTTVTLMLVAPLTT